MSFVFRRTSPSDYDALVGLFREALEPSPGAPLLDRAWMNWKYWNDQPAWPGSRGFTLEKDGELAAHGAAWPVPFKRNGETLLAMHLIDWAASRRFPGAGVALLKRILRESPAVFNIGGSHDTEELLPLLGFERANSQFLSAKPLRPWRQTITHQRRNYKLPFRAIRNWAWSRARREPAPQGWSAAPVRDPDEAPAQWWADSDGGGVRVSRTPEWYRYILSAPGVRFELFDLRQRGETRGYFCLARCPGQVRLADYAILGEESEEAWNALAALALDAAGLDPDSAEMAVWTSHDGLRNALNRNSFRGIRSDAIRCSRAEFRASGGGPYFFTALDSDAAFLYGGAIDYLT